MDNLYKQYADIPALEQQTARILEMFDSVEAGVTKLSSIGVKLNTTDSSKAVDKLTKDYAELSTVIENQKKQLVELAIKLAATTTEEAKQAEGLKQTIALVKGLTAEEIKRQKLQQGEYVTLQAAKQANNELNKSIQLRIKLRNSEDGSIEQLNLRYTKLAGIITKLSDAQRNSERGQNLVKQAGKLKEEINELQKGMGNFTANVGRYSESLGGLFENVRREISRLKTEQDKLNQSRNTDPAGFASRGDTQKIDEVTRALEKLENVERIGYKTGQSYYQTVNQIGKAYADLANTPGVDGKFLEQFKNEAAQAKDSAADLKDEIKALSSDTRGLDLAVGSISVIASAFEAGAGAAALFGGNTEDIARVTQKLVAIQSVANGVREVGEQITKRGTAANIAYNFVLKQTQLLFGANVTGANRFNAALKLTGIGLAITALGFLIDKLDIFGSGTSKAEKETERLNKSLERQAAIIDSVGKAYDKAGEIRRERLKQQGADDKALFNDEVDQKKRELEDLKQINFDAKNDEAAFEEKFNKKIEAIRARGYKGKITMDKKDAEELAKQRGINAQKIINSQEAVNNKELELTLFTETFKTKTYEETTDKQNEANKKAFENAKKYRDDEKKAALELLKFRQGLIVEENNIKAEADAPFSASFKIDALNKAFDAQKTILDAERNYALQKEKITVSERLLINEKYADDLIKLERKTQNDITNVYINETSKRKEAIDASIADFEQDQADRIAKETEIRQKGYAKEQANLEIIRDQELAANAIAFENELKTTEQFNKRKEEINLSYQKAKLNSDILFYQRELEILQNNGEDTTAALQTIANLKAQLAELGVSVTIDAIDKEKEALDALKQKYVELGEAIENAFTQGIANVFERQKNDIQTMIDKNDELKEKEIERISKTSESEEVKAAKIKIIEANAEARKEALLRRQRQIDRQKAIFDCGAKVFEIITDNITAINKIKVAAAAAVNPVIKGLLLSQIPITIATGAAGLLTLLSTPIPKYFKGTESSVGGVAEVAEVGRELAVEPSGKIKMFNKRGLTNLIKGTKIFPNRVTEDIMAAANNNIVHPLIVEAIDTGYDYGEDIVKELKQLNKKPPMKIEVAPGIEATEWYNKQFKN